MPELFNRIGQPRWGEGIRRLLGIEGAQGIATVMPELVPVHIAVPDGPEVAALRQERLCVGNLSLSAGGAGTFGKAGLVNPANSGVLAILEALGVQADAGGLYTVRVGTGSFGAAGGNIAFRDGRWGFGSTRIPSCSVNFLVDNTSFGVVALEQIATQVQWIPISFVLAPGDTVHVMGADNAVIRVNFAWRERIVLAGELSV